MRSVVESMIVVKVLISDECLFFDFCSIISLGFNINLELKIGSKETLTNVSVIYTVFRKNYTSVYYVHNIYRMIAAATQSVFK